MGEMGMSVQVARPDSAFVYSPAAQGQAVTRLSTYVTKPKSGIVTITVTEKQRS
jgi:hypothetical protein